MTDWQREFDAHIRPLLRSFVPVAAGHTKDDLEDYYTSEEWPTVKRDAPQPAPRRSKARRVNIVIPAAVVAVVVAIVGAGMWADGFRLQLP